MNQDNQRAATKRRIVKPDVGNELEDRQMMLMDAPTPEHTTSVRPAAKTDTDKQKLGSVPAVASGESGDGGRAQVKMFANELKAMRGEIAQELRELQKAVASDIRASRQEMTNELRAQQLAALGLFKSGLSSILKRLETVLAVVEHNKRVASVTPAMHAAWWTWGRGGRVIAVVVVTALVFAVGLGLLE